jgi:hypothetical protein
MPLSLYSSSPQGFPEPFHQRDRAIACIPFALDIDAALLQDDVDRQLLQRQKRQKMIRCKRKIIR